MRGGRVGERLRNPGSTHIAPSFPSPAFVRARSRGSPKPMLEPARTFGSRSSRSRSRGASRRAARSSRCPSSGSARVTSWPRAPAITERASPTPRTTSRWTRTIVVPKGAPETKRERIEAYGAKLVVSEHDGYDGAETEARALAERLGVPFLSPYDDEAVIAGNGGTLVSKSRPRLGTRPQWSSRPSEGAARERSRARAAGHQGVRRAERGEPCVPRSRSSAVERSSRSSRTAPTLADGLEEHLEPRSSARRPSSRASSSSARTTSLPRWWPHTARSDSR